MQESQVERQTTLTDNFLRLSKFRTRTVIADEDGRKIVCKYASDPEALPFLELIISRERQNVDYLKGQFRVLCGTLKNKHIEYEYISCRSLIDTIAEHLRQNGCSAADEIFRRYVEKVQSLGKIRVVPEEFLTLIAGDKDSCKQEMVCLRRGVVDLTPRNILVDGSRWIVIDNEWSFDFPVPRIFILFRAIKETSVMLQREIRRCTNRTHPAVGIFARGLRTYYFPESWVKYIADTHISIAQMLRWELGFQHYITGSDSGTVGRIKMNNRTKFHFSPWRLRNDIGTIESVSRFLKRLPCVRRLVHFSERMLLYLQK